MSSTKPPELAQFRDRFRAFRATAGDAIEKVGKSAYRLKPIETEEVAAAPLDVENVEDVQVEVEVFIEPDAEPIAASVALAPTETKEPELTEAMIEAEVRAVVSLPEVPADRGNTLESLIAHAEHTWREGGHWLGRRFAVLFNRS
jgi:hypothetical protein